MLPTPTHRCWIVGAGDFCSRGFAPSAGDLLLAADGGQRYIARLGLRADVVVGDLDSLPAPPPNTEIIRLPVEKDDTDMLAAVKLGLARGCRLFFLYGGTGGRLDHTVANLQILCHLARRGARALLVDGSGALTAVTDGELCFDAMSRGTLSVFAALGEARGVTLEGLKYPLEDATLEGDYPLGVSNAFTGTPARVAVRDGTLLVAFSPEAILL